MPSTAILIIILKTLHLIYIYISLWKNMAKYLTSYI